MSTSNLAIESLVRPSPLTQSAQWYALHTRARHEKRVALELQRRSFDAFLPCAREMHRWSDRRKMVEVPLFSGYVFLNAELTPELQLAAQRCFGVLRFICFNGAPAPIPQVEMEAVRTLLEQRVSLAPHAFLKLGQRVRIRGGCLDGVEGILAQNGHKLVVSVNLIERSLAVSLDGYDVEAV